MRDEYVTRFAAIYSAFLELDRPLRLRQAVLRVRDAALDRGIRGRRDEAGSSLETWVWERFEANWIERVTRPYMSAGGDLRRRFEDCSVGRQIEHPASVYALILATLYGSADEALTNFLKPLSLQEERASEGSRGLQVETVQDVCSAAFRRH